MLQVVFFARGRAAWIASLIVGVIGLIVGLILPMTFLIIAGAGFALFGLVFLILSFVTGGATD